MQLIKKYVDDKEVPINNEITALKNEFMAHVNTFLSFRRNINTLKNEFFGNPSNVDITLANINTKLNDIISRIPHKQIRNIVYTVTSGVGMWTPENNTIKYTAEITGIYRMSVLSNANFKISTTSTSTGDFFKTISVLLDKDSEEIFTLELLSRGLSHVKYWWCLEFVAQLI